MYEKIRHVDMYRDSSDQLGEKPVVVLIVDDDPFHRCFVKEVLSIGNYATSEAATGKEALSIIDKQDIDVVLLDKQMPGIKGDEVCSLVRNVYDKPLLPIIMVTASDQDDELTGCFSAGANDFIRKPYDPVELLARINAVVRQKRVTDQLENIESLLFTLARMVEAMDEYTGDHCSRLEHICTVFGNALNLNKEHILALRRGGVLHDIGKLGIPDAILLKRGPLIGEEWEIMRQHTVIGTNLLSGLQSMTMTIPIVRHHHERWDGSGYPDGLSGKDIPVLARIFQIADIYDALSSERPYKEALTVENIIHVMEEESAKGWRDPDLIKIFIGILRTNPEDLVMPENEKKELGARIHEKVMGTGVDNWSMDVPPHYADKCLS